MSDDDKIGISIDPEDINVGETKKKTVGRPKGSKAKKQIAPSLTECKNHEYAKLIDMVVMGKLNRINPAMTFTDKEMKDMHIGGNVLFTFKWIEHNLGGTNLISGKLLELTKHPAGAWVHSLITGTRIIAAKVARDVSDD